MTVSNEEYSKQLEIQKNKPVQNESDVVSKEHVAKLLRTLFEKDGQPHLQQQILSILCNSVNLTISSPQMATINAKDPHNSIKQIGPSQSLSDLWINYLINKSQQAKG